MVTAKARRILSAFGEHSEEWHVGRATATLSRRCPEPLFDRRLAVYLDLPPRDVDLAKISRLLRLLDRLGRAAERREAEERRRRRARLPARSR